LKWTPKAGLTEAQAVTIACLVETGRLQASASPPATRRPL
jgi:hypothetical protein